MGHKFGQHQAHGADETEEVPLVKMGHITHQHHAHGADETKQIHLMKKGTPN